MNSLSKQILDELSGNTLADIIEYKKYKIRGFRINGPNSKAKTKIMRNTLLKKSSLMKDLQEYSNDRVSKEYLDNTWTFVSHIDEDLIISKLKKGNREHVILELISNRKEEEISRIIKNKHSEQVENKGNKQGIKANDVSVNSLRNIIRSLEEEIRKVESDKKELQIEKRNINNELLLKKGRNHELKEKLDKTLGEWSKDKIIINDLQKNNFIISEEKTYRNKEYEVLKKESGQFRILIIGGDRTIEWFENNNQNEKFKFDFLLKNSDLVFDRKIDEIWVLNFHINSKLLREIRKSDLYLNFKSINRIKHFDEFNSIKLCMMKVEQLL